MRVAQAVYAAGCCAGVVPVWSHRRFRSTTSALPDLALHLGGGTVGADRRAHRAAKLAVTANTYTQVLTDEAELDYPELLNVSKQTEAN
jgi:hypothetical protein